MENVLDQRFKMIITHDINRILRELAGTNDKKDNGALTPSSPMTITNGHFGAITPLTLDTNGPQTPYGSFPGHYRKNSIADLEIEESSGMDTTSFEKHDEI